MDDDDRHAGQLLGQLILATTDAERDEMLQEAATSRPQVLALSLAAALAMLERAIGVPQLQDVANMMLLDPEIND